MGFRFLHMADVHLGTQQYGLEERAKDFARAFRSVAQYAIERQVDFVLIAGDLFDKSNPHPEVLWQAETVLRSLKEAGIPVAAIAGNHDRGDYRQRHFSWLTYLAAHELLYLLDYTDEGETLDLKPWSQEELMGGYVDVGAARIMGIRYLGLAVTGIIEKLMRRLEALAKETYYPILMLHVGIQGYTLPGQTGTETTRLKPLEGLIRYIALGHVHLKYEVGHWIFNPGSLETWRMDEARHEHGFFLVEVRDDGTHEVTHHMREIHRRPFWVMDLNLDQCRAPKEALEMVARITSAKMQNEPPGSEWPVVVLNLQGKPYFDLSALSEDDVRETVRGQLGYSQEFKPFVRVRWSTEPSGFTGQGTRLVGIIDRDTLERLAWREIYGNDPLKRERVDEWTELAVEVRRKALELGATTTPKQLADFLETRWPELARGQ